MADQIPDYAKPEHLLWSPPFLKVYGTEASLMSMVDCPDEKTFQKWVKIFVTGILWLESDIVSENDSLAQLFMLFMTLLQIHLENRFDNDILNDCLMSVDGTYFCIKQFRPFSKVWHSHKWKGPGLRYKIGVCICTSSIVWITARFLAANGLISKSSIML